MYIPHNQKHLHRLAPREAAPAVVNALMKGGPQAPLTEREIISIVMGSVGLAITLAAFMYYLYQKRGTSARKEKEKTDAKHRAEVAAGVTFSEKQAAVWDAYRHDSYTTLPAPQAQRRSDASSTTTSPSIVLFNPHSPLAEVHDLRDVESRLASGGRSN